MTADVKHLPTYSKEEEIANSISHFAGLIFSVVISLFFVTFNVINRLSFFFMLPFYIYSFSMMIVFFISSFYHSSPFGSKKRAIARIIDHCDIYLFVFATYLPICVHAISNQPIAIAIIVIEGALMILGIALNLIPNNSLAVKIVSYLIYIIDGWIIIFFYPFEIGLEFYVFLFVLLGGIVYSVGAITYAAGKKKKWFHSIFHIFVVLAAILQFVGILFILI